jgi:hypothetical protein
MEMQHNQLQSCIGMALNKDAVTKKVELASSID